MSAWQQNAPITMESGVAIASDVMRDYGKELQDFKKWWVKNGPVVLEKING